MKTIYKNNDEINAFYHFRDDHKIRFMLRFEMADGSSKSIVYRLMTDLLLSGDTSLTISFIHKTIKITGQNLQSLFDAINDKSVGCIIEQHVTPDSLPMREVFIDKIDFFER